MNFLYIGSPKDLKYAAFVKACVPGGHQVIVKSSATNFLYDITSAIRQVGKKFKIGVHGIIVSDPAILAKYLHQLYGTAVNAKDPATLHNYQGAMFEHEMETKLGVKYRIPVVIIGDPQALSYDHSKTFLATQFIRKLYDPSFLQTPILTWTLGNQDNLTALFKKFNSQDCILCSIDIETKNIEVDPHVAEAEEIDGVKLYGMTYLGYARTDSGNKAKRLAHLMPMITCVGYTGIFREPSGALTSHTVVIPFNSWENYHWVKQFNLIPAPKVFHNGLYDNSYFLRVDAPVYNWAYDTYGLMHSWYVELPRTLAATSALVLRNHMYWKDESGSNLYEYCAKDCHSTAWACLAMLATMPDWAIQNFQMTFKQVFPALTCNLEGFKENEERAIELWEKYRKQIKEDQYWWDRATVANLNTGSPPQMKTLFVKILGAPIKSTSRKDLEGIQHKHPLWRMLVDKLIETRESRKADSTYMNIITFCGRILYALDPFGTTTSRYACRESAFWCGTQVQNIPVYAKYKFEFDAGWTGTGIDNAQSESRTTAYIVNDPRLIDAVENAPDFHTRNASLFFGISEAELFRLKGSTGGARLPDGDKDVSKLFSGTVAHWESSNGFVPAELAVHGVTAAHLTLAHQERDLFKKYRSEIGKRINHGANYNMGESVLVQTMTPLGIIQAKITLKLPAKWTFEQVAAELLSYFDAAYPLIRSKNPGGYHYQVMTEVQETSRLVTPDGWTRWTFLKPWAKKVDLNALVAHKPQSWSVRIINKSFFDIWHKYQIVENKIRIKAQIHDENMYQVKPEFDAEVQAGASAMMARPNKIRDIEMVIPNDPKGGARFWIDLKD